MVPWRRSALRLYHGTWSEWNDERVNWITARPFVQIGSRHTPQRGMKTLEEGEQRTLAVIGAGAVGGALARRLAACGYDVQAVISRTADHARTLAGQASAPIASDALEDLPETAQMVFCCVPDAVLAGLAERLSALPLDWTGRLVVHTSGALTTRVLAPLAKAGALTLSFHPMQTFAPGTLPDVFAGIYVALEGSAPARAVGHRVAEDLGARPLELAPEAKVRYHLAAAMASNFLVTLMALAEEVLASIGLDPEEGAAVLRPLVEGTWRNLADGRPEEVLTGPAARGDGETLAQHAAALEAHLPHLAPVYKALVAETVRVAVQGGKIPAGTAQKVLSGIHAVLEPDD